MSKHVALQASFIAICVLSFTLGAQARGGQDGAESEGGNMYLAFDLEYAGPIDEGSVESGLGGALRLGLQADLILVSLAGEIGGSYHDFGGAPDVRTYRGFVGGRISVGKVLEPGIYGHLGIGRLSADPGASRTVPTFDAGVFLDLTVLPVIDVGVHLGYDTLLGSDGGRAFDYYVAGAHAGVVF